LKYLFIVGVGRSGTSLLQSMLSVHPDIDMLPETAFLRRFAVKHDLLNDEEVINDLLNDDHLKRLKIEKDVLRMHLQSEASLNSIEFYQLLLDNCCSFEKDRLYVGDKDPRLIEYLPFLFSHFESPQVVNVVRDPRDILVSKKKADWSSKRHPLLHIFANIVQIELAKEYIEKNPNVDLHTLVYEELLSNPECTLKKLCDDLSLPFVTQMINNFGEGAKKLVDKAELSWKKETFGPLLKNNTDKWKRELDDWEIALIERSCKTVFTLGGYKVSGVYYTLPLRKRLFVSLMTIAFSIAGPLYKFYRNYTMRTRKK